MLRTLRTLGLAGLVGMVVSAACTIKNPEDPAPPNGGGGEGGEPGDSGGKSGGGSAPRAGTSGGGGKTGGTGGKGGSTSAVAGGGGEGGAAEQCPGCASGFCLDDGTCVDCLASNDQCPQGQYCTEANECAPGCKADGSSCASGVCNPDHNCANCLSDDECVAPLVCGAGVCSAACTAAQEGTSNGCEGDLTCCALHCTDMTTDSQHCGGCNVACGAGQFCGSTACAGDEGEPCVACHDTTVANVCAVTKIIVVLDDAEGNRAAGRAIGAALAGHCQPTPELIEANQDSIELINFQTGRPVSGGGELLVVAGGPFYQVVQGYLEESGAAPLYWYVGDDFSAYRKAADDSTVASLPLEGDHDSHDYFIVQFMRDPASGSLVLNAQGLWLSGTNAAVYLLENEVLPNLASYEEGWYAYEWTDADDDQEPSLDEIDLIDSGS